MGNLVAIPERGRDFEGLLIATLEQVHKGTSEDLQKLDRRLFGNGQPGEIGQLREDIKALTAKVEMLTEKMNWFRGALWALGSLSTISAVLSFLLKK